MTMEAKWRTQNTISEKPIIGPRPCTRCQFGIFDAPVPGKMNCLEAGTSNIKQLTKEEVEEMTSCDKMVRWTKMEFNGKDEKGHRELKLAEKLLGNR
jgi:hypothetical protein